MQGSFPQSVPENGKTLKTWVKYSPTDFFAERDQSIMQAHTEVGGLFIDIPCKKRLTEVKGTKHGKTGGLFIDITCN